MTIIKSQFVVHIINTTDCIVDTQSPLPVSLVLNKKVADEAVYL